MERDLLYKQIKLAKNIDKSNLNLNLKQEGDKETSKLKPISFISYLPKKKKKEKRKTAINQ